MSLPNSPPGPAVIRTMSPPNDAEVVSSETEVIAAASGKPVRALIAPVWLGSVPEVKVTFAVVTPFTVFGASNATVIGATATTGASSSRFSRDSIASSRTLRGLRVAGPLARGREG